MKDKNIYSVSEIFTPTQPAIINYVERIKLESKLIDALSTPGKQIVIYGHSGSGKTSLIIKNLQKYYEDEIMINCTSQTTINEIFINAFDYLNKYYITEKENSKGKNVESELKTSYFSIKAKLNSEDNKKEKRIVPVQLTAQRLAEFLGEAKCCLILEDFHKVNSNEKKKLSQIMKVFMDASIKYPSTKIIAIGAVDSAREIIKMDKEMMNRVAEIKVPLMSNWALKKIIKNGCKLLNIEIVLNVELEIINYSSGLAAICHQICLNMCRNKDIIETREIDDYVQLVTSDFNEAIKMIIENMGDTSKHKLDNAFKSTRYQRYDNISIILYSILQLNKEELTRAEILEKIQEKYEEYPAGNLSKYLKELTSEKRGKILRYDKNSNKYSFSDPLIRATILFRFNESHEYPSKNLSIKSISLIDPDDIKATLAALEDYDETIEDDLIDNEY